MFCFIMPMADDGSCSCGLLSGLASLSFLSTTSTFSRKKRLLHAPPPPPPLSCHPRGGSACAPHAEGRDGQELCVRPQQRAAPQVGAARSPTGARVSNTQRAATRRRAGRARTFARALRAPPSWPPAALVRDTCCAGRWRGRSEVSARPWPLRTSGAAPDGPEVSLHDHHRDDGQEHPVADARVQHQRCSEIDAR
jgi:hypothetical protein